MVNVEQQRLDEAEGRGVPWRRWGPYLSERQWGVVREDYSGGLLTLLFRGASAERLRARIRGVSRTPRPQRTAVAQ